LLPKTATQITEIFVKHVDVYVIVSDWYYPV